MKYPSLTEKMEVIRHKDLYPNSHNYTPICPICEENINYGFKFKHCPHCGQLLDWNYIRY